MSTKHQITNSKLNKIQQYIISKNQTQELYNSNETNIKEINISKEMELPQWLKLRISLRIRNP